jgi:hypothetical protein
VKKQLNHSAFLLGLLRLFYSFNHILNEELQKKKKKKKKKKLNTTFHSPKSMFNDMFEENVSPSLICSILSQLERQN